MTWRVIDLERTRLEVFDHGEGEPVLFIQTALTADELVPLADSRELAGFRRILMHRRGYAGSAPAETPGSIPRDAADCAALISNLELGPAHVMGLSFSGAVALQLTVDRPELVSSLTLVEPPPVHTPGSEEFRRANLRLFRTRKDRGAQAALDEFLELIVGPNWRRDMESRVAGSVEQVESDAGTFFDVDMPALLDWEFGPGHAGRISCPVLYVGGSASGQWFTEVRELMLDWLPHAVDVVIDGADHSLALTHTAEVARAVGRFLETVNR